MSWVVDASVIVEIVLRTRLGESLLEMVAGRSLFAPDLLDAECLSALRGLERRGDVTARGAGVALDLVRGFPVTRLPSGELLAAAWPLRHRVTAYDALYVAAAQELGLAVLTADGPLSRAPGLPVIVHNVRAGQPQR